LAAEIRYAVREKKNSTHSEQVFFVCDRLWFPENNRFRLSLLFRMMSGIGLLDWIDYNSFWFPDPQFGVLQFNMN
jgi:hypothetical protein